MNALTRVYSVSQDVTSRADLSHYRSRTLETSKSAFALGQNQTSRPRRWTWLGGKGQTLLLLVRDTESITSLRAAIDSNPADVGDYAVLAAAYALSGHSAG
jgi:predicted Zn-dependent protease